MRFDLVSPRVPAAVADRPGPSGLPLTVSNLIGSEKLVVLVLFAAVAAVAVLTITPWPVGAFQDDAMYTVLAKSLAEGHGFRFINLPGSPNATHFPPGYPAFLALLWKIWPQFPENVTVFKFANAAMLGLAACGSFIFSRRLFDAPIWISLLLALSGTLSIVVLLVTGVVMSEPMFLALLFVGLLVAERAAKDGRISDAVLAGALCGTLGLVRTIGTVSLAALFLILAWRRLWRPAMAAAATGTAFMAPWQIWVKLHSGEIASSLSGKYGSYSGWALDGYAEGGVRFALEVLRKNIVDTGGMLGNYFLPVVPTLPRLLTATILLGIVLMGTKRYYRNAPVSLVFVGLYMLVVMFWPFEPARFLVGIWPLLPLLIGCGALSLWRLLSSKRRSVVWRSILSLVFAAMAGGSVFYNYYGFTHKWWTSVQRDAGVRAKPTVEWAVRYTKPSDILSTEDDLIIYLYSGRRAVPTTPYYSIEYTRPTNYEQALKGVLDLFSDYDPDWYIVGSAKGVQIADALALPPHSMLRYTGRTSHMAMYRRVNR